MWSQKIADFVASHIRAFDCFGGVPEITVPDQLRSAVRVPSRYEPTILGASNLTYAEATWSQKIADFVASHVRAFDCFGGVPEITVPDQLRSAVRVPSRYEPTILGASNLTYAEATWSQKIDDFVASHVRAFVYFGGVPEITVPDQLRSAGLVPSRYEPRTARTYADLGRHSGTAIVPARRRLRGGKGRRGAGGSGGGDVGGGEGEQHAEARKPPPRLVRASTPPPPARLRPRF